MKTNLSCKTVVAIIVCLTFFTTHSNAQTSTWTNALGGIFADNGNWDIGAPGPTGTARFDRVGTYGVALNADTQIESVFLVGGNVAFVGGNLLKLTGDGSFRGDLHDFWILVPSFKPIEFLSEARITLHCSRLNHVPPSLRKVILELREQRRGQVPQQSPVSVRSLMSARL